MEHNPLAQLSRQLFDFFTTPAETASSCELQRYPRLCELIRCNNENLDQMGDVSLLGTTISWRKYCQKHGRVIKIENSHLLDDASLMCKLLLDGQAWKFPLQQVLALRKERYALSFQRQAIISLVLPEIVRRADDYGKPKKDENLPAICVSLHAETYDQGLRHYRAELLYNILRRLLAYSKWQPIEPEAEPHGHIFNVIVQSLGSASHLNTPQQVHVITGMVLEPETKLPTTMTGSDYLALRSKDMLLMAMHRHGVRDAARGAEADSLIKRLGEAAATVDLFEVRHASPALAVRCGMGCSKGAVYVLYNSARLETLLRNFTVQVAAGMYPPLPPIEQIDFSLLKDDLDWQLIYGYLMSYPELLEASLEQLQQGKIAVHLIVRYMFGLVTLFSRFYRRKQILLQQRAQLLPVLHARIYLIKTVRQVLNSVMAILGIDPVDYM